MNKTKDLPWWSELENIVDNQIRPSLQLDSGDIRLVDFDQASGVLSVELQGQCAHCPMMEYTLKEGIEVELKTHFSQIKEVRAI